MARLSASALALLRRLSVGAGPASYAVLDPARPALGAIAHAADGARAEACAAIDRAHGALGEWRARPAASRADLLYAWHERIAASAEELAQIMTLESGKALVEARKEVAYGNAFVRWFAEEARRANGEILQAPAPDRRLLVLKQPIGVVGAITPWNFPLAMVTRKVAPALAAGCTVVVKPAEATPLCALALRQLGLEAGLPPDVFSVVTSSRVNTAAVGDALCADARVRLLSFTGSTAVGRALMARCAPTVKRLALELGGNAPFVVFEDADLDVAARALAASKLRNAGQACVATNRVLVHEAVRAGLLARLEPLLAAEALGHGLGEGVSMGPLISAAGAAKFDAHVDDALAHGAALRCGGADDARLRPLRAAGAETEGAPFCAPTIVDGVHPGMALWREETFGPLVAVASFSSEAEALRLANDSEVGLAAYFCTRDMRRVWRFAEALEVGMVGVNEGAISTELAPFGGVKQSGLGREGHRLGLEEFLEYKYIAWGGQGA